MPVSQKENLKLWPIIRLLSKTLDWDIKLMLSFSISSFGKSKDRFLPILFKRTFHVTWSPTLAIEVSNSEIICKDWGLATAKWKAKMKNIFDTLVIFHLFF